jgi:hypothetical protein
MRAAVGRPHWIVLEEIHRLMPEIERVAAEPGRPGLLLATERPAEVAAGIFSRADLVVALGAPPTDIVRTLRGVLPPPDGAFDAFPIGPGDAIAWRRPGREPPFPLRRADGRGGGPDGGRWRGPFDPFGPLDPFGPFGSGGGRGKAGPPA